VSSSRRAMAPLIVLIVATLVFRLLGRWWVAALGSWPAAVRAGLAVMFAFTAMAHFNEMRHQLAEMLPSWVPNAGFVILFTGLCELAGAIGLLIPKTRRAAAVALVLFLIAVFPANVHAAQEASCSGASPPRRWSRERSCSFSSSVLRGGPVSWPRAGSEAQKEWNGSFRFASRSSIPRAA
jgi:uncharacterized membrane protein